MAFKNKDNTFRCLLVEDFLHKTGLMYGLVEFASQPFFYSHKAKSYYLFESIVAYKETNVYVIEDPSQKSL